MSDEIFVSNFIELHEALKTFRKNQIWLFRGQKNDPTWNLRPKAGRNLLAIPDQNLFRAWKRYAVSREEGLSYKSDWDWLALAQHYGLPTRLLDWTVNPLVAAFFAIKQSRDSDGVIYAFYQRGSVDVGLAHEPQPDGNPSQPEPFNISNIQKVKPRYITSRLLAQEGIFTIHNPPEIALEDNIHDQQKLIKIVIDKNCLEELRIDLSYYGINEKTMFPDLGGLSDYMSWWYHPDYFDED